MSIFLFILGTIDFDPVEPIYNVSDPVSLRCVVHNSSEWQSLLLARSGFQSTSIEPLFEVTNKNGNIQVNNFSKSSTFTARPERLDDGVAIVFEVDKVRCNDSGVYICGNILGNYTSPVKVKSTNTSVYITGLYKVHLFVLYYSLQILFYTHILISMLSSAETDGFGHRRHIEFYHDRLLTASNRVCNIFFYFAVWTQHHFHF
jgi:hypothetical protein